MLLDNKGWIAKEFFSEYLDLKMSINQLSKEIEFLTYRKEMEQVASKKAEIKELSERLLFVLEQLKMRGVKPEHLILLSIGVDISELDEKMG